MNSELNSRKIKQAIENLENSDIKIISISELEDLLTPLFSPLMIKGQLWHADFDLIRGVKGKKPSRLDQVSYPNPERVNKIGRINHIGQSIFYACTIRNIPFFELDAKVGDQLAIARWRTTEKMLLIPLVS